MKDSNSTYPARSVKYPDVTVKLSGTDGNAFAIIGRVAQALRKHNCPSDEVNAFMKAAMNAGSYDGLLQLVMKTVEVR